MKQTTTKAAPRREVRTFTAPAPLTVRTLADGTKQLQGHAIVFNSRSLDLGGFTEICSPGMLDRTLKENPDVLILRDHKQELLLGRTTAGTLTLTTDDKGLRFAVNLPKTPIGDDTAENVRLSNLTGCSFGFSTVFDDWAVDSDGNVVRTLLDVDLYEISITSFPAYESTSVSTRSAPKEIRAKLTSRDWDDCPDEQQDEDGNCPGDPDYDGDYDLDSIGNKITEGDPSEQSIRCACRCEQCAMNRCERCYHRDCTDDNCEACPMQDDQRSEAADRARVRTLLALKITASE